MRQRLSIQEAIARAKAGDADAQYALSSALHEAGQLDECLRWLRLAASRKLIPAQLTLAAMLIDGQGCPRDLQQAIDLLRPLAVTQPQANLLLAELHGFAALDVGDRATGLRYLAAAARLGDAGALRQLALLGACHQRSDLLRPLFDAAARRGDSAAAYALARCHADGIGGPPDPALAIVISGSMAVRGQYLAERSDQSLVSHSIAASPAALPIDWRVVEDALPQLAGDIPLPRAEPLCECPEIRRLPGVIHRVVADALINLAAPLVQRSQIVDARTGEMRVDPMRTDRVSTIMCSRRSNIASAGSRVYPFRTVNSHRSCGTESARNSNHTSTTSMKPERRLRKIARARAPDRMATALARASGSSIAIDVVASRPLVGIDYTRITKSP